MVAHVYRRPYRRPIPLRTFPLPRVAAPPTPFEAWLRWPTRTEQVLLHAELPLRIVGAWTPPEAPPHQVLGVWVLGTAWTLEDQSAAYTTSVSRFVALTGFAGGIFQEVIGVREDGVDLTHVASSAVASTPGSWFWDPATGSLLVRASASTPASHTMLAIVRFRFANRPIVLNTDPDDPNTGQYYHPWITGQAPSIRRATEDLLYGATATPSGDVSLLNVAGLFFHLCATDGNYIWKNADMRFFVGGAYDGIDFDLDDYVPIEAMIVEDVAVDETACTFQLQTPTRLTASEIPITPYFEGDYPNLGDGVRGTKKWIGYGRSTISPDLTDALPAIDIASSSIANPSVITTDEPHRLVAGNAVVITGHTSATPDINGQHLATVISPTTFSIPVNVTDGGIGGTVTRVVSIYTVADAAFQTLFAIHNVWAVNKSTKVRTLLTLTTDYTVDLTLCTVTIVNATYAHATYDLAVDVTGKPDGLGGYLKRWDQITRDILQTFLGVPNDQIDAAAFALAAVDNADELALWIKSPRTIGSIFASAEQGLPSLGRSVAGTVQQDVTGRWTGRIWTDTPRGDEILLQREDFVHFSPQPRLKGIYATVRVHYNFDHAKQEWSFVEYTDDTVTYETGSRDRLDLYTYQRLSSAAEDVRDLYMNVATRPAVEATLEERGCRLIAHRAGDRFLQTFAPAPTLTRGYVEQLFGIQSLEISFAPKLTVRGVARLIPSGVVPVDPVLTYSGPTTGTQNLDDNPTMAFFGGTWFVSVNIACTVTVKGCAPGGAGGARTNPVGLDTGGNGGGGGAYDGTGVTRQLQPGTTYEFSAPAGAQGVLNGNGANGETTRFAPVGAAPFLALGGGTGGGWGGQGGATGGTVGTHDGTAVAGGTGGLASGFAHTPAGAGSGTSVPGGGGGGGGGAQDGVTTGSAGGAGGNSGQAGSAGTLNTGGDGGRGGGVSFAGADGSYGGGGGGKGGDHDSPEAGLSGEAGVLVLELVSVP